MSNMASGDVLAAIHPCGCLSAAISDSPDTSDAEIGRFVRLAHSRRLDVRRLAPPVVVLPGRCDGGPGCNALPSRTKTRE